MNASHPRSVSLRCLAAAAVAFAPTAAAAEEAASVAAADAVVAPKMVDVELQPGGLLIGQLVSATGQPTANSAVKLTLANGSKASAKTNAEGGFAFKGVSGVARLDSERAAIVLRSWEQGVAPPNSAPAVLLVEGDSVVRGQHYAGTGTNAFFERSRRLFANPLFVAGLIGTAVAVPVAIANSDDDPPASP